MKRRIGNMAEEEKWRRERKKIGTREKKYGGGDRKRREE